MRRAVLNGVEQRRLLVGRRLSNINRRDTRYQYIAQFIRKVCWRSLRSIHPDDERLPDRWRSACAAPFHQR
jgi:hypothetical protein